MLRTRDILLAKEQTIAIVPISFDIYAIANVIAGHNMDNINQLLYFIRNQRCSYIYKPECT